MKKLLIFIILIAFASVSSADSLSGKYDLAPIDLTNATGLPVSTGVSGLGAGVADFLGAASSANLKTAVTDETGSGVLVFATSPTLVTPSLGTATFTGGLIRNLSIINVATYDLLATDDILHITYTATAAMTSLTLPTAQVVAGRTIVIKDAGNASTNNITIDTEGAETIDGAATLVISTDYNSVNLYSDGTNWFIY